MKPRHVFVLDAIGALVSTSLAALLLLPYARWFGFPPEMARLLSGIGGLFVLYSGSCAIFFDRIAAHASRYLLVVAAANSAYCATSLALLVLYRDSVTRYALGYFGIETVILAFVVALELRTARRARFVGA